MILPAFQLFIKCSSKPLFTGNGFIFVTFRYISLRKLMKATQRCDGTFGDLSRRSRSWYHSWQALRVDSRKVSLVSFYARKLCLRSNPPLACRNKPMRSTDFNDVSAVTSNGSCITRWFDHSKEQVFHSIHYWTARGAGWIYINLQTYFLCFSFFVNNSSDTWSRTNSSLNIRSVVKYWWR